jgi:hypothetical protein
MPKRRHLEEMRSVWTTCAQYVHTCAAGWQGTLEAVGHEQCCVR